MNEIRYWIHAVTPLHVGAGRGLGYIDLPVVREKVTNWPYIPGSSLKGVIADHFEQTKEKNIEKFRKKDENKKFRAAFGVTGTTDSNAGSLIFTDANIFCLPIRSFYGTFAWITSPFCLRRFDMNITLAQIAFSKVRERKKDTGNFEDYKNFALSFPSLIHSCGLVQAVSFAISKNKNDFIQDLEEVLKIADGEGNLQERSRNAGIMEYMRMSRRALSSASWIKRYCQSM